MTITFRSTSALGRPVGRLCYGFAHFGKSLFWYGSELLFAFYLTEVAGLAPITMGIVLSIGLLTSAAIDLVVGARMTSCVATTADAGRMQAAGAWASSAATIIFLSSGLLTADLKLASVVVASLAFRIGYAFYDLPQNALLSLGTSSRDERTSVASIRFVFSGLAALGIAAAIPPLLRPGTASDLSARYLILAIAISATAIVSALALARMTRRSGLAEPPHRERPATHRSASRDAITLIALTFVASMAAPVFTKLETYFAAFTVRSPWLGGGLAVALPVGMIIAQPAWKWLGSRIGRDALIAIAAVCVTGTSAAFWVASTAPPAAVIATALAFGAASGGIGMALWSSFADVAVRDAAGREGQAFAWFTASAKAALAVGGLAIGVLLARLDYRGEAAGWLPTLMALPSACAGLTCVALIRARPLSAKGGSAQVERS